MAKPNVSNIYGKIQYVNAFPNDKVEVVDAFPDLKVQEVFASPRWAGQMANCGCFP